MAQVHQAAIWCLAHSPTHVFRLFKKESSTRTLRDRMHSHMNHLAQQCQFGHSRTASRQLPGAPQEVAMMPPYCLPAIVLAAAALLILSALGASSPRSGCKVCEGQYSFCEMWQD